MARTQGKPGPKPRYGKRRDYHILLAASPAEGEVMSLAEAFEQAAKDYEVQQRRQAALQGEKRQETSGLIAYLECVLRERPEIAARLKEQSES